MYHPVTPMYHFKDPLCTTGLSSYTSVSPGVPPYDPHLPPLFPGGPWYDIYVEKERYLKGNRNVFLVDLVQQNHKQVRWICYDYS